MLSYVRQAISANGGTPQSFRPIDAWRELVTVYGGTPTQYNQMGLMRQAITAAGGTPTQWTELGLLRELISALGATPTGYQLRALYAQLASAVKGGGTPTAPAITASSITGTPQDGQTLTSHYTATGYPTPTPAYQWQKNGVNISSQTGSTITLNQATMSLANGDTISCEITVTNASGSASAEPTIAYVGAAAPTAPVLTRTSSAGTNPMTWSAAYTGLVVGTSYITMRWRVNGGSWTNETDHLVTSDDAFDMGDGTASFAWPLYDAHTFSSGDLVEVQEGHKLSGTTAWSTILSDTIAGAASYAHGGKATSATSSTAVSFTSLPFTAGKALVALSCFSNAGGTVDSVPTSLTLTPTGGGTSVTLTKLGSGGRSASRAVAIYVSATNITAGNYDVTGTRPNAARSNVLFYGSLTGNSTPTTGPTFTTGTSEVNPHATASATCPTNGIVLGWLLYENSVTFAANTGTTLIDQTFFNSECGLLMGYRADTGTISVNASPNSNITNGRGVAAFQP